MGAGAEYPVSEACQINDLDHNYNAQIEQYRVSEACQINDLDHLITLQSAIVDVSEACQINDLDHPVGAIEVSDVCFRSLSDQ